MAECIQIVADHMYLAKKKLKNCLSYRLGYPAYRWNCPILPLKKYKITN
jgi:hypothetical protein